MTTKSGAAAVAAVLISLALASGCAAAAAAAVATAPAGLRARPLPGSGVFSGVANIAVTRARVWVFGDAANGLDSYGRGTIAELSTDTGRLIRLRRERQPGQTAWVAFAYGDHPWTTVRGPGGVPWLAEVNPGSGALTRRVRLASTPTPEGLIAGAATLAGRSLWAVAGSSPEGTPAGLVQLSASSGARTGFVRWPPALRGFDPQGMAVSGAQIWMTDGQCRVARVSVPSDRARVFKLPGRDCQLGSLPAQISAAAGHVWVEAWNTTVANDGSVAELSASTGRLVRFISGRAYGWDFPSFTLSGPDLWVTSQAGGYHGHGLVTELSTRTGRLVRLFAAHRCRFDQPFAIAAWRSHVWVLNLRSLTRL